MRRHELIQKKNSTSDRVQYECDSCGYEFMGILSDDPAGCPKCKSKSLSYEYMNNEKKNSVVNVDNLDAYEKKVLKDMNSRGISLEDALKILINQVEGDWSQLSDELKRYAKRIGMK